jgi:GH35 family endo-1,4-beta-xylanase
MLLISPTIRRNCLISFLGAALVVFSDDASAASQTHNQADATALSPFGIGSCYINNRSAQDNARWIPQMAAIGIHMTRTCHTAWDNVEQKEGQWSWDALDKQMNFIASNRMEFGGILIGSVPWDKEHSVGLPVGNVPAWSNYVFHVVQHVGKKVKYWEVWNEPPNFIGPKQTAADYAKILVSAYDSAKKANPDCLVGLAAKSVHVNFIEHVIKAGARNHFDFITLHPYEVLGTVADGAGTEALYVNIVPTVRKMLAAQNPAKTNVPIIFTELGYDAGKSPSRQAEALVKAYTMGIAQGVDCIEWFEGRDGDSGPMGLLDNKGNSRPAYTAMAQMIKYLGEHPIFLGWEVRDGIYEFYFRGRERIAIVAWARKPTPYPRVANEAEYIIDLSTGKGIKTNFHELTSSPILWSQMTTISVQPRHITRSYPFRWDGDYADSKSVSITMGATNDERGLHTLSGDAIAADVIAYGGPARAGSVPGGNAFVVDPNFLSYSAEPIEITVVVRRNPANDNAGFKLVYESTDGFKNFGWYTVPDNKQWHTKTWKITDAQFVGMWGYNFTLESDGNVYNKYYIKSVTVKKLEN